MYNNPLLVRPEKFVSFELYLILKVVTHYGKGLLNLMNFD